MSAAMNPFPGLRPFRSDEHHLFFGREEQTAELLALLRQHRFLAVVGTSGSGKSSLVQAGLIPALHRGTMTRAGSSWEVVVLRPGGHPIENLARALAVADLYDAEDPDTLPRLGATLNRSRFGLVEAIRQSEEVEPDTNLLVVVDQFEELFRFRQSGVESEETAAAFVNLLFAASEQEEQRIYIALTMRSDYLGDCSDIPELAEAVNRGEYLIPRLLRDQKREAIEKPIGVGGARISPRLVQRMLNDIGDDPDQLPVLQHALMRTWEVWSRRDHRDAEIDFADFEATGGLAEALSRHADEIYHSLPDDGHRQTCERLYRALTVKGSDNRGIRRPTRLASLEAIAGADRSMVTAILEPYRRAGVTFLMPGMERKLNEETVIDLSHESLMRCWRRLDNWVEDESQSARIYQRVRETAALHAEGNAGLYHDPDLQIAQSWREDSQPNLAWAEQYGGQFEPAMAFLDQSEESARKSEREQEAARTRELERVKESAAQARELADTQRSAASNFKRFAIGMGVVALVALGAFLFALKEQRTASKAKAVAEQLGREAVEKEEQTSREFALSDASIGQVFVEKGDTGRGIAHLVRSLEREPSQSAVTDRIFNLFAYQAPPLYELPSPPEVDAPRPLYASVATADASVVAFTFGYHEVLVWKPESPEKFRKWEWATSDGSAWYGSLALSSDGTRLFVGRTGGKGAELIDLSKGERMPLKHFVHFAPNFSARGDRFLTGAADGELQICDTATGEEVWSSESGAGKSGVVLRPVWSPDERHVALHQMWISKTVSVVGLADEKVGKVIELKSEFPLRLGLNNSFSPDGSRVLAMAVRDGGGSILVWGIDDPEPLFSIAHDAEPSGHVGQGAGGNPKAYFNEAWNTEKNEAYGPGERDPGDCYVIGAFTPDGQRILTAGMDKTVRLWSASAGELSGSERQLDSVTISDEIAWSCEPLFSEDGRRFMIRTRDYGCLLGSFGPDPGKLPDLVRRNSLLHGYAFLADAGAIKPLQLACGQVTSGCVHPREPIIALGTANGRVALVNLRSGEPMALSSAHAGAVVKLVFNRDGSRVAARSSTGTVRVWDTANPREQLTRVPVGESATSLSEADRAFAAREDVLAVSVDGSMVCTRDQRIHFLSSRAEERFLLGHSGLPAEAAAFTADARFVATVSADKNSLQIFSSTTGGALGSPLAHEERIRSLGFSPAGGLLAAGCESGAIRFWHRGSGKSADHTAIKGEFPCSSVVFGPRGQMLAAVFDGGPASYAQVWDAHTGHPITGPLRNGTFLSRAQFIEKGNRLVVWPQQSRAKEEGLATVWDVTVSAGEAPPDWFSGVATSFGGSQLNEDSLIERVAERKAPTKRDSAAPGEKRLARFFEWLQEFPGTRPDSPFRPDPSDAYIESLVDQSSFVLMDEAVRLRPNHAKALARRGVLRRFSDGASSEEAPRVLSRVDLTRARLLDPEDAELAWYEAIFMEAAGDETGAKKVYDAIARNLKPMDSKALARVIDAQELHASDLGEGPRRELLDQALIAARRAAGERSSLATRWLIKRFLVNVQYANFAAAQQDWQAIKELENLDEDWSRELLKAYAIVATAEANSLAGDGNRDAAVRLLEPVAILAELARSMDTPPKSIDLLVPTDALRLLSEWKLQAAIPAVELVAARSEWRYLDDGSDLGSSDVVSGSAGYNKLNWKHPDFDDSGWKAGLAKLGYGGDEEVTTVGGSAAVNSTTYFRQEFEAAESDQKKFLNADVVRDDGVIIYLNGVEVMHDNMPAGEVTYEDFASEVVGPEGPTETRSHRFAVLPEALRTGRNVIVAEVHQCSERSTDLGFEFRLESTDHPPGTFVADTLGGEEGDRLQESVIALLPKRLREQLKKVLAASLPGGSVAAFADNEETCVDVFWLQCSMNNWEGAVATADARLESLAGEYTPVETRMTKEWLGRKESAFTAMGRPREEIGAVQQAIFAAPPRNPDLSPKLIDLSEHYTASMYDGRHWAKRYPPFRSALSRLPETFVPRKGVGFDLRGVIQLNSGVYPQSGADVAEIDAQQFLGLPFPDAKTGIRIGQKSKVVHFLTALHRPSESPGVEVARFVMHYDDKTSEIMKVNFVEHVSEMLTGRGPPPVESSQIGWRGSLPGPLEAALSDLVWKNPHPDKTISHIDFISAKKQAAPFLVGITLE